MNMPKKGKWIVIATFVCILIGVAAIRFNWFSPIDPSLLIKFEPGSYAVTDFRDGDTIVVDMNGSEETIRFIGIDTPETHKPNAPVQCYGVTSSAYTKKRIGDSRVRLVADRLTTNRDRYNRLLRYVVLEDGTYLNYELVQKGYAFAYDFPFANAKKYDEAESFARQNKVGIWGNCTPTQDPKTGQWHSNDIPAAIETEAAQ